MRATFKDVTDTLRAEIWPEGEASNLVDAHTTYFKEAFIELQRYISPLRQNNVTTHPFCSTYIQPCGVSVIELPRGEIQRVFTLNEDWCDKVIASEVDFSELDGWAHDSLSVNMPANEGLDKLPSGIKFAEASTDSEFGRSRNVIWARRNKKLYLAPWIQSNEMIVVEWDGEKRTWEDTDAIDLDYWDPMVMNLVRLYVLKQHETFFGEDPNRKGILLGEYREAFADVKVSMESQARRGPNLQDAYTRFPTKAELDDDEVVAINDTLSFCHIADSGTNDANEAAVAALVSSLAPELIIHGGDVAYSPVTYAQATALYSSWIGDTAAANRFWPCPGNHDWDVNSLADFKAFFTLLNNERYYDFALGPVHFFALDSDSREPSGITISGAQYEWLAAKVALSPAKWKVGYFHHTAYTSGATRGAETDMRWDFKALGLDIVFMSHEHNMEDVIVNDFHYVTNGSGGQTLYPLGAPISGSDFQEDTRFGAIYVTVTCSTFKVDFYTVDKVLRHTFTLHK